MSTAKTHILSHRQILRKLTRIAYQVYESNLDADFICIAGVNERGGMIGRLLHEALEQVVPSKSVYLQVEEGYVPDQENLKNKTVILVDDVLNTGKTLINIMQPFVQAGVRKLEVAVLADRNHRLFPVHADYVGISMATTLQEHISFDNSDPADLKLYLS